MLGVSGRARSVRLQAARLKSVLQTSEALMREFAAIHWWSAS